MKTIRISDVLKKKVLVTRESAHELRPLLLAAVGEGPVAVTIDFEGVEGVTPSFLDELLGMLVDLANHRDIRLLVSHPPTRLTAKFTAVGRSRGLELREEEDGSWLVAAAG